jgi:hypothetical protein
MSVFINPAGYTEDEQQVWQAFIKGHIPDQKYVRPQFGLIDSNLFQRMRIVLGKTKARIDADNLALAYLAVWEEDRALAEQETQKRQMFADVEALLANIPDFNKGDEHNVKAAQAFFSQNPNGTAEDFIRDLELHPDHYHWYSGPRKPDIAAILHKDASPAMRQVLVATYGEAAVNEAWNTIVKRFSKGSTNADAALRHEGLKTAAEKDTEAKAAQAKRESDPREIERAKARVESLIGGVRVSNNHAENGRVKAYLRGLQPSFIAPYQTETNWFRYEEAVQAYINSQVNSSIG